VLLYLSINSNLKSKQMIVNLEKSDVIYNHCIMIDQMNKLAIHESC